MLRPSARTVSELTLGLSVARPLHMLAPTLRAGPATACLLLALRGVFQLLAVESISISELTCLSDSAVELSAGDRGATAPAAS